MVYNPFSGKWETVNTINGDQLKFDNKGDIKPMVFKNFAVPITTDKKAPAAPAKAPVKKTGLKKM